MSHVGYVVAGWSIGLGTLAVYGWSILRRARVAARHVPARQRRWMTSDER